MAALQLVALFCIMFLALGIFNLISGRRREQRERMQGVYVHRPWYRRVSFLTGVEYVLLAAAFLLNVALQYRWLPTNLDTLVIPFYILLLLASGLLAGIIIFYSINNARKRRTLLMANTQLSSVTQRVPLKPMTAAERVASTKRKRERRRKSVEARRRRAGKA